MTKRQIEAQEIKPGMIIDIWGDRVPMDQAARPHRDGRRLMIGPYAVQPTQPVEVAGYFNL